MIDPSFFFEALHGVGIRFFTGVPDSLLKNICAYLTNNFSNKDHIIAANEGNAVGLGIGYHLATGNIPLIYMQNSGLGNTVNPLMSLADDAIYSIPLLLVVGWRGEPGKKDEPQHVKQGEITLAMLDVMDIPYMVIEPGTDNGNIKKIIEQVALSIKASSSPFALVIKKNVFSKYELENTSEDKTLLGREKAIHCVLDIIKSDDIVVSTTGMISREVFEYRKLHGISHEKDFLTVGGMGHANQIALGIALQKAKRQVFCLDGDGATLMHMGSLGINGSLKCSNFKHIILNNSAHDSVGGQPTVGNKVDFTSIAKSSGYLFAQKVSDLNDLEKAVREMYKVPGPSLLEVEVRKGAREDLGRPDISPVNNKKSFMEFLLND